jgi:hypothetical protein
MEFAMALTALAKGHEVRRAGWDGKDMYLVAADDGTFRIGDRTEGVLSSFIVKKQEDGSFAPWIASQAELLANDWEYVKEWIDA